MAQNALDHQGLFDSNGALSSGGAASARQQYAVPADPTLGVLVPPTCRRCGGTAVGVSMGWLDAFPFSRGATPRRRRGDSRTEARVNALVKTIPLVLLATASVASAQTKDPVDYVDTRIGTISHMLVPTFPSIQRPNGMLRIVPPNERFTTDRINGFNLSVPSHRQGAVFRLMPASGSHRGEDDSPRRARCGCHRDWSL